MVLAIAMMSISAMAADNDFGLAGSGGVDILGTGIFETNGALMKFPSGQDTNIDTLEVGNDRAMAYGSIFQRAPMATATNNLEIKKNQDTGPCECCTETYSEGTDKFTEKCNDCCTKVNIDQIKVGNRDAMAFGFAAATNNVKIVANQQ
ncbi:MAG: hypothetical protein ACP5OU_02680 [Methanothrix sp.]